jgi:hypothetical protein
MAEDDPFADLGETLEDGPEDEEQSAGGTKSDSSTTETISSEGPIESHDPVSPSSARSTLVRRVSTTSTPG